MKLFLSLYFFLASTPFLFSQANDMAFFEGTWKFEGWQSGNKTSTPSYTATWYLEKGLTNALALTGHVELNNATYTREMIVFNPYAKEYVRTIVTNDSSYFIFTSKGWKGKTLTWLGSQYSATHVTAMKEEVVKISDTECKAVFYTMKDHKWTETQSELLKKQSGS